MNRASGLWLMKSHWVSGLWLVKHQGVIGHTPRSLHLSDNELEEDKEESLNLPGPTSVDNHLKPSSVIYPTFSLENQDRVLFVFVNLHAAFEGGKKRHPCHINALADHPAVEYAIDTGLASAPASGQC